MAVEEDVRPERRIGVREVGPAEVDEQLARRGGIPRRLKCLPVRLGLHPPADQRLRGRQRELDDRDDEERQRHRGRLAHPAAASRRRA